MQTDRNPLPRNPEKNHVLPAHARMKIRRSRRLELNRRLKAH